MGLTTNIEIVCIIQFLYFGCRCLVPKRHKSPKKWKTNDMAAFRAASDKEMLKKVRTVKYDRNFNNWINHKVLERFTKKSTYLKTWSKSYNFKTGMSRDRSNCVRECRRQSVSSDYAESCEEIGGIPSCCISTWKLGPFEKARNYLIGEGLIKSKTTRYCGERGRQKKDPCVICRAEMRCLSEGSETKKNMLKKSQYHLQGHGDQDTCEKANIGSEAMKKKSYRNKKSTKRSKVKKEKSKRKKPKKKRSKNRSKTKTSKVKKKKSKRKKTKKKRSKKRSKKRLSLKRGSY